LRADRHGLFRGRADHGETQGHPSDHRDLRLRRAAVRRVRRCAGAPAAVRFASRVTVCPEAPLFPPLDPRPAVPPLEDAPASPWTRSISLSAISALLATASATGAPVRPISVTALVS